jgi:hypothetical protein
MVFSAELILEGNTYLLNSVSIEIGHETDQYGRPSSITKGGKIAIELFSMEDDAVFDWMIHPGKTRNGTINLFKADNETKVKEIKFENGYCTEYFEVFSDAVEKRLVTKFTISAEKLSIGNVELDNKWLR